VLDAALLPPRPATPDPRRRLASPQKTTPGPCDVFLSTTTTTTTTTTVKVKVVRESWILAELLCCAVELLLLIESFLVARP